MSRSFAVMLAAVLVLSGCAPAPAPRDVVITGLDYAFAGPDTIAAGETVFTFRNTGTVRHELKLIALRPGVELETVLPLARIDSGWAGYREPTSGILTAGPGESTPGRLLVTLEPDRKYLLVCAFADSDSAPLHSELGMIRVLHVH